MREEVVVVVVVVGDGQDKMMEVLAARAVETGAARATAEVAAMAVKETSAGRTAVVVEDTEEEQEEEVTDSNLEHTQAADTTHKARAAGTASKAKVVGTISKLRVVVVRMASNRRATIPTGNRAAMTLSLALEDWTPRQHRYFSRYPIASLLLQLFTERDRFVQQGRSARQIPMASLRGDFFRRSCLRSVFPQAATRSYPHRAEGDDVQAVCLTTTSHSSGRRQTC
jgi:hypothetical protein